MADDDADFRRFLRITLERDGYAVEEARDGTEALLKVRLTRPAVVLIDFDLGIPNGAEVVQTLRTDPSLRSLPVVFVTTAAPARLQGAQAVLEKPVDPAELVGLVNAVLERTSSPL